MANVDLYWDNAHTHYAVLVSPGFGSGWSTWNDSKLAYDARAVQFWLDHKDDEQWMSDVDSFYKESPAHQEATQFFRSIGYDYVYFGGFANIELKWVPAGTPWRIKEYDGAESLVFQDKEIWTCF